MLTVGNAEIELTFNGPIPSLVDNPYWGLRWNGDHVSELEALLGSSNLIINDGAIGGGVNIFLENGFTYVGLASLPPVPEPSSFLLLGLGLIGLVRHSRRRRLRA